MISIDPRFLVLLIVLGISNVAISNPGSGNITGTFIDAQAVQPSEIYVMPYNNTSDYIVPTASGHGTEHYEWSLYPSGIFYLDDNLDIPYAKSEISDMGLTYEEIEARVSEQLIPSGNELIFSGLEFFDLPEGETFVAGRINYSNQQGYPGTSVNAVDLIIESISSNIAFNHTLALTINIVSVLDVRDRNGDRLEEESADFIYFAEYPELGSFRVFEEQSTDVEILMRFGSLGLVGFGAVGNPCVGFVSMTIPEPSAISLGILTAIASIVFLRK